MEQNILSLRDNLKIRRNMKERHSIIFEKFKRGEVTLFIIKPKGRKITEIGILDIAFRKLPEGRVGIMFWQNASEAERSILDNGRYGIAEVCEVDVNQLSAFTTRILNGRSADLLCYNLM